MLHPPKSLHAGLALGVALLQLPWVVVGVMLAGTPSYYAQQQNDLTAAFCARFRGAFPGTVKCVIVTAVLSASLDPWPHF